MPNKSADLPTITIAKFENALHERSAFSCGFAPIDNFLKSSLSEQIKDGMVAAWMATAEGQNAVLGFYTLGAMAVRAQFGPKKWQRARVPDIPVIYIRAVAVRQDMQGRMLGTALVVDAMKRCLGIAEQMARQLSFLMCLTASISTDAGTSMLNSDFSRSVILRTREGSIFRWPM
ncbi:hypothetical protein [Sphingopyxis sp.]|uniref:hypothetical protein n=1 Tax=Sphingopyxis sp. TaxID=1908224 RepID=UPI0025FC2B2E|nr:hypothetical protein [Sphingopyxis sp.]MBK6414126.1 hypothetical protein [Sphingopyxis sp.]